MNRLSSISETELYMLQRDRADRREFELRSGDVIYGSLHFAKYIGSSARACAADGVWSFKWSGVFRPCLNIRVPGEKLFFATYAPPWFHTKGVLRFSSGVIFHWQHSDQKPHLYEMSSADGDALVTYDLGAIKASRLTGPRICSIVHVDPKSYPLTELSLLVLLGCYLSIRGEERREENVALEVRQ